MSQGVTWSGLYFRLFPITTMFETIKIQDGSSKLDDSYFVLGQRPINGSLVLFRSIKVIAVSCYTLQKCFLHRMLHLVFSTRPWGTHHYPFLFKLCFKKSNIHKIKIRTKWYKKWKTGTPCSSQLCFTLRPFKFPKGPGISHVAHKSLGVICPAQMRWQSILLCALSFFTY